MKPIARALIVAAIQMAIISSLGAKLLYDRAMRPRVWVETTNYDPDLPIRGRYVALSPQVELIPPPALNGTKKYDSTNAHLEVRSGKLVAIADERGTINFWTTRMESGEIRTRNNAAMLYFLPEHAKDPTRLETGQVLWVEATIPKKGPPRPIRLGIKQNGVLTPLDLR